MIPHFVRAARISPARPSSINPPKSVAVESNVGILTRAADRAGAL
jgi:hypothetical protein